MKTTAGTTAAIFLGLATMISPAFADDTAKPQTLTETEKATAIKAGSLVGCVRNTQLEMIMNALSGKYSNAEGKTAEELLKKDFEAAVKTCETSAGITVNEANVFSEELAAKYGGQEETQRIIDNTFNTQP